MTSTLAKGRAMDRPDSFHLNYVSATGSPESRIVVVSCLAVPSSAWAAVEEHWMNLRHKLECSCGLNVSAPLRISDPDPSFRKIDHKRRRSNQRRVLASGLRAVNSAPAIHTSTIYARTSPDFFNRDRGRLFEKMIRRINVNLAAADAWGMVITDLPDSAVGRKPLVGASRILESPIIPTCPAVQGLYVADLVAWTGYQHVEHSLRADFPWNLYSDLEAVDQWGLPVEIDLDADTAPNPASLVASP